MNIIPSDEEYHVVKSHGQSLEVLPAMRLRYRTIQHPEQKIPDAYRLHFSVQKAGKYFRKPKRIVRWVFGLTNKTAVKQGKNVHACRGEEHEVELIWNVTKGKAIVYWNKRNISHLFPGIEKSCTNMVHLNWHTRSGEKLEIEAHANRSILRGKPQYNLLIDGTSFHLFPALADLERNLPAAKSMTSSMSEPSTYRNTSNVHSQNHPLLVSPDSHCEPSNLSFGVEESRNCEIEDQLRTRAMESNASSTNTPESVYSEELEKDYATPPGSLGFRLSLAGLSPQVKDELQPVRDELHSDLYTSVLESMRCQITESLPQTEEILSQAIINSFYTEHCTGDDESVDSVASSLSDVTFSLDSSQIEVDYLWQAYEWAELNRGYAPRVEEVDDMAFQFFQKVLEEICARICNEEFDSDAASRILLNVAALLGLKFASPLPRTTLIFCDLDRNTTSALLENKLASYGTVESSAVSKSRNGFGFCRFQEEQAVLRLLDSYHRNSLAIGAAMPTVTLLTENGIVASRRSSSSDTSSSVEQHPLRPTQYIIGDRSVSPVPHLMASLTTLDDESVVLKRSSSTVYDSNTSSPSSALSRKQRSFRSLSSTTADTTESGSNLYDTVLLRAVRLGMDPSG